MITFERVKEALISHLQIKSEPVNVFDHFSDQNYIPTGCIAVSIGKVAQQNPGVYDFIVEFVIDVRSEWDYDPGYLNQSHLVGYVVDRLNDWGEKPFTEYYSGNITTPIAGVLPLEITEETSEDGRMTTILYPVAFSFAIP